MLLICYIKRHRHVGMIDLRMETMSTDSGIVLPGPVTKFILRFTHVHMARRTQIHLEQIVITYISAALVASPSRELARRKTVIIPLDTSSEAACIALARTLIKYTAATFKQMCVID